MRQDTRLELRSKRVLVVGLARSGRAAVELLLRSGSRVVATDLRAVDELGLDSGSWADRGVELVLGEHPQGLIEGVDLIVLSPGVPIDAPIVESARVRRVPVVSELELAYQVSRGTWIAVTGTNGKTTTTALTGALARTTGRPVVVGGNIGVALSDGASEFTDDTLVVAEVSSFQLDSIATFRPHVAVLLNITEDHLDRYDSFESYADSKKRIFMNQTVRDFAVLNVDDPRVEALVHETAATTVPVSCSRELERGVFVRRGIIVSRIEGVATEIVPASDLKIAGPHNLSNAVAALAAALLAGVEADRAAGVLRTFEPLEHRMEQVAEIDGVRYVNDSKATNVESVRYALESYDDPVVLIAGGLDKGSDFSALSEAVKARVRHLILIGDAAESIERALGNLATIERAASLDEAVRAAARVAAKGDVVLLSPACASFDMFVDFEDRGRRFKALVAELAEARARQSERK